MSSSRSNVASQACQTCRKRKTKCDEQRPKCTLCQRLNLECKYQESSPVKKDQTMVHILDSLQRLEAKFDDFSVQVNRASSASAFPAQASSSQQTPVSTSSSERYQSRMEALQRTPVTGGPLRPIYPYFTLPHRTIVWPAVYSQLMKTVPQAGFDLDALLESGTPWLLKLDTNRSNLRLPFDVGVPSRASEANFTHSIFTSKTFFPTLTNDRVNSYTDGYFGTFNMLYPILDQELFMGESLSPLLAYGFSYGDKASVLALLVLALGHLAVESLSGAPIQVVDGEPSGICGGSAMRPPGLELFNEARARMGSLGLLCDLISVHISFLQATYFEASACHMEYWRSTVTASMACQALGQYSNVTWSSLRGDLITRAFWACSIGEDFYHLDLDLPRTTIREHADEMQLPHFQGAQNNGGPTNGGQTLLQYHYTAKIALAQIIRRIHEGIQLYSNQAESIEEYSGPPTHVIQEMTRQLDSWRAWLPQDLQWMDEDVSIQMSGATQTPRDKRPFVDSAAAASQSGTPWYVVGIELLTVELRARFYFARFILCRPFIFKALHFAQLISAQDAECCASAIRDACLLPLVLSRMRHNKRLLPHLFTWTQNFIAILLVLWISTHNDCLRRIRAERLDNQIIEETTVLMLHWIKDIKQIDSIAAWSWQILQPLFAESYGMEVR